MRLGIYILLAASCLSGLLARAEQKIPPASEIPISQNDKKPWKVGDSVCIDFQNEKRCGEASRVEGGKVWVRFNVKGDGIDIGSPATASAAPAAKKERAPKQQTKIVIIKQQAPAAPPREDKVNVNLTVKIDQKGTTITRDKDGKVIATVRNPAGADGTLTAPKPRPKFRWWNAGVGVEAGFNYVFPAMHVERALNRHWSAGGMLFYTLGDSNAQAVNAKGGFLTGTYYFNRLPFRGFFLQNALGYYFINVANNGLSYSGNSAALSSLFAWRGQTNLGINLMFGAGLQYALRTGGDESKINFSGVMPLFSFEVGYNF